MGEVVITEPPELEEASQVREVPYSESEIYQKFFDQYKNWKGTAYRLGGMSKAGIDCSAFVHVTYKEKMRIHLPRTTHDLAKSGMRIPRGNLSIGDLILFKTGFFSRHVGIYMGNGRFIHASKTDGVTLSSLTENFWDEHYWMARKIIQPSKKNVYESIP
jgi:cell wall-associated NlpC family hydrolase